MIPSELSDLSAALLADSLHLDGGKEAIAQRFLELGVPGSKSEQYRHFSIKPLLGSDYTLLQPLQGDLTLSEKTLEIKDGVVTTVPKGVNVTFESEFEADMTHFDPLYYLSHLLAPRCILVGIACSAKINIVHHIGSEESLLAYRIVLTIAPSCQVEVHENFKYGNSSGSLLLYGLDVSVGESSNLTWIRSQSCDAADAVVIGSHRFDVRPQAKLTLQTFDFGGGSALHLYKNDLADHTQTRVSHLLFATAKARRGNVVHLCHNGVYATSVHLAKSILKESATGIFDGLIRVDHDARYANARQNAKAILLNDNAFMEAKPQLEIYTDELEASHGSSTGQLDEEALFYLRSRGIGLGEARKMLILSYANEMIAEIQDETLAKQIRDDFEAAYYKG